jgi:acetyl-CoA synthetase
MHEGRFVPEERLAICAAEGIATLCQAPTEYRILAKRTELRPVPSLRRLVSAGEPLNPEVMRAFREGLGLDINDGYGQTETGALTGSLAGEPVRDGSMGKALPGIELRIDGGELILRHQTCPTFFSHYIGSEPYAEKWWRTGDLVAEDDDGYLWFEGRADDVIISSGYRIGPFEVESALLTHPRVAEAAAVAMPDEERGSIVKAIVVLRDAAPGDELARELQDHVKSETAPYKYPRIVEFAESLPKTASGKIKRAELRAASGSGPGS